MATDSDRLLVNIEASQAKINKQLAAIAKAAGVTAKGIETDFERANDNTAKGFEKSAAAAQRAAQQQKKTMAQSRAVATNLSFQLQDIAQGLMVGTSPFTLMAQQGGQVVQALSMAPGGAGGAIKALGSAVGSLLNPMSLATFAIIGLGAAAVQYFTEMLDSGEVSNEVLQKQEQLIQRVADRWGEAIPSLRAYADQIKRVREEADLQQAVQIRTNALFDTVRKLLPEVNAELSRFAQQAANGGWGSDLEDNATAVSSAFDRVESAINEASAAVASGKDATEELARVQEALNDLINNGSIPATGALRDVLNELAGAYRTAAGEAAALAAQQANLGRFEKTGGRLRPGASPLGDNEFRSRFGWGEYFDLPKEKKAKKPARERKSDAEREAEAIARLIEELEHELSLIGQTAEEQAVMNNLRKLAASATDEQKAKVEELTRTLFQQKEAQQQANRMMNEMQALGKDVLGGFIRDLREGKSASEALAGALQKVADKLLDMALTNLFSGGIGGGVGLLGGKIIPGILHNGGVAGRDGYGHGRAVSPSVFTGAKRYHKGGIAGLQPGEVPAILQKGEVVLPRGSALRSAGSTVVQVVLSPDLEGRVLQKAAQQSVEIVSRSSSGIVQASVTAVHQRLHNNPAFMR